MLQACNMEIQEASRRSGESLIWSMHDRRSQAETKGNEAEFTEPVILMGGMMISFSPPLLKIGIRSLEYSLVICSPMNI